jgi:uncharacterized protein YndB with AHSA1/START domain
MAWTTAKRMIDAPVEMVFNTVAHIEEFRKALPYVVDVEFLTEQHTGVGTRFRETRLMQGKRHVTELEVTEYEPYRRVRLVTDTNGTIWDTVFSVDDRDGLTRLELAMDANAHKLTARLVNPLIKGFVQYAIDGDLDRVKKYCESLHSKTSNDSAGGS